MFTTNSFHEDFRHPAQQNGVLTVKWFMWVHSIPRTVKFNNLTTRPEATGDLAIVAYRSRERITSI